MTWLTTHFAILFGITVTLFAAVLILRQRRTPQSAAAWLLFILFVPYLAIPIFLGLGFRKQVRRFKPIQFSALKQGVVVESPLDGLFQHYNLPAATNTNAVNIISDGCAAWDGVLTIIKNAQYSLDITFYLIADDAVGRTFVEALTRKVKEGVRVRLIIDQLGGFRRPFAALTAFKKAGGHLRDFSPLLNVPDKGHLNLRNHRKMIIADGVLVFSGGRNIGGKYLGADDNSDRWSDLSFELAGPACDTFRDVFASDWAATGSESQHTPPIGVTAGSGNAAAQLVPSGPDMVDDPLHDGIVSAIHSAKSRVWICTPYFLPTEYLEHAMLTAAKRGIDVRILVPLKSNQPIADFARGAYLRGLERVGGKIMFYKPLMMHAKAGIVDDVAWIGSANFDVRSMLFNFETVLFLYDNSSVASVSDWFSALEGKCRIGTTQANLPRRIAEGVFRLGAPIL